MSPEPSQTKIVAALFPGRDQPDAHGESFLHREALGGWELLESRDPGSDAESLIEPIRRSQQACVFRVGSGRQLDVELHLRGLLLGRVSRSEPSSFTEFGSRERSFFLLGEWLRTIGVEPRRVDRAFRIWFGDDSSAVAVEQLLRAFLIVGDRRDSLDELPGWKGPVYFTGPRHVAETYVDWDAVEWVIGRGDGFTGLWKRGSGEQPARWPETVEGYRAAEAELLRRVARPVIESTVLPGVRAFVRGASPPGGAYLLHYVAPRQVSVMAVGAEPRTVLFADQGVVPVWTKNLVRLGEAVPDRLSMMNWRFADWPRARVAALAALGDRVLPIVHPVPEHVERGLPATMDWILSEVDAS